MQAMIKRLYHRMRHRFQRRLTPRRWEAAQTHRLNEAHWYSANRTTINEDLAGSLQTLRIRCAYEAANNGMIDGVIFTHQTDVNGEDGPNLQVQSSSVAYNNAAEALWRRFWRSPDVNGRMRGVEILDLWLRNLWLQGEFIAQIVSDVDASGPVQTRLRLIHPRRLATPPAVAGAADTALGVRRTKIGRPVSYFIAREDQSGPFSMITGEYDEISARDIIHWFRVLEEDQVRGVPWLATGLGDIADTRDYGAEVMEAARQAANHGVVLTTKHPDAQFHEVNESTEIERGTMRTAPPGYEFNQMTPQQPSTQYVNFTEEHQRPIGRPVNMPLMMIRLDSRKYNYSSARFDSQVYQRGVHKTRGWFVGTLKRLFDLIVAEAELAGALPRPPSDVELQWIWPAFPHVDPMRESKGDDTRLRNASQSLTRTLSADGVDLDRHVATLQREIEAFRKLGLRHPAEGPAPAGRTNAARVVAPDDNGRKRLAGL